MKKGYATPILETRVFDIQDVVRTSGEGSVTVGDYTYDWFF